MSQLRKREEVWIMAYSAFISSRTDSVATIEDAAYADKALAEFDKRFPVFPKLSIQESEYEDVKKAFNAPGFGLQYIPNDDTEWGMSSERQEELKGIAASIRKWIAETENKVILEHIAMMDIKALEVLRDAACSVLKDKATKNNSQL